MRNAHTLAYVHNRLGFLSIVHHMHFVELLFLKIVLRNKVLRCNHLDHTHCMSDNG